MKYSDFVAAVNNGTLPEGIPELDKLKDCPNASGGTVWEHTVKVLANAKTVLDNHIPETERETFMVFTAVHDIGKPECTVEQLVKDEMKITAYKHGKLGAPIARSVLEQMGAPEEVVDTVENMVAVHCQIHTMNAEAGEKSWRKLAAKFPLDTLGWFGRCDSHANGKMVGDLETGAHPGSELAWKWAEALD